MNILLAALLVLSSQSSVEAFAPATTPALGGRASFVHVRSDSRRAPLMKALMKPPAGETDSAADVVETNGMPDLISFLQSKGINNPEEKHETPSSSTSPSPSSGLTEFDGDIKESLSFGAVFSVAALVGAAVLFAAGDYLGVGFDDVAQTANSFVHHPQQTIKDLIEDIKHIGPAAPLFFGLLYCIAEILAIPATPLTLSAGYLFGLPQGVAVVLASGTLAACISFAIGKTALRGAVEELLQENPEFRKLDKAIGKEGFKLLVLVRLTPIFPFAISNYIYGASAIKFWPYFWGTLMGFTPGTIAYVYTGMVGQAVMTGQGNEPWYYYVGGLAALAGLLKVITDTATGIVRTMEEDMEE